jgi:hypothetical protein
MKTTHIKTTTLKKHIRQFMAALAIFALSPFASIGIPAPGCGTSAKTQTGEWYLHEDLQNCPASCNLIEQVGGSYCWDDDQPTCDWCLMSYNDGNREILGCMTTGTIVTHPGYCMTTVGGAVFCTEISGAQTTSHTGLVDIVCDSGSDCIRCPHI